MPSDIDRTLIGENPLMIEGIIVDPEILFAYGTLRGNLNGTPGVSHYVLRDCVFIGNAKTAQPMGLYVGEYPCVDPGQPISPVQGELYRIDRPETMKFIDDFEDGYDRVYVDVIDGEGRVIRAVMYIVKNPPGELIPSGDFADFRLE